jgi:GntR family transcriptional regulator, transcriptional repressor for pyruvate dehydrogenase complex
MPTFKPIKQSRVSEEVTEQMKRSILVGYFKSGDKLPSERELAEQFKVSRVAIREALRVLENTGFLTTRQGVTGGAFVTDLTFEHLSNAFIDLFRAEKISIPELVQVRLLVEPEIARQAALNIDQNHAKRLKEALKTEELPVNNLTEDLDTKTAVHYILAEICGNRFFEALERSLMALTRRVILVVKPGEPFIHPAGMHHPVVEAIISGDADLAFIEMKKHTIEFGENLIKMERAYRDRRTRL